MKNTWQQNGIKWVTVFLKNSKYAFLVLFSIGFINNAHAQLPNEAWHGGFLVLNDFDTVRGEIKYNFQNNLVQVRQGEKILSFSTQVFVSFSIHDQISKRYRAFYSVPFSLKSAYKAPVLFELLQEGEHLTLLAREVMVVENVSNFGSFYYSPRNSMSRERLDYEFYFMKKDAKIVRYNKKKRDLYFIMNDRSSEMKRIMKKKKLKHDRAAGLVRITAYYNELKAGNKIEFD